MIRAAVRSVDITPPIGCHLQGHDARQGPSVAVHDPLRLQVLTLSNGRTRLAIITSDLLYFESSFHDSVRAAIEAKTGLPGRHVLLSASHTHTGPFMVSRYPQYRRAYVARLQRQIVSAVAGAIRREQPAQLRFAAGSIDIGIMNRRRRTPAGVIMQPNPGGPIDPFCGVLRVDGQDGQTLALLFQYACHPTTLSTQILEISADYPGEARRVLEQAYPGAQAMFLNGCCGDVRPAVIQNDQFTGGSFADTARMGRLLASEVIRQAEAAAPLAGASLSGRVARHRYALDDRWFPHEPRRLRRLCRQWQRRDPGAKPAVDAWLEHWLQQPPHAAPPRHVQGDVQVLSIGDLSLVALTGEVMVEYSLALRARHRGPMLIAAYAQGALGYVPTRSALREGGYEARAFASRNYPAPFSPRVQDDLLRTVGRLITRKS
jgi:hypothetical protein